jgi:hypothetical protein
MYPIPDGYLFKKEEDLEWGPTMYSYLRTAIPLKPDLSSYDYSVSATYATPLYGYQKSFIRWFNSRFKRANFCDHVVEEWAVRNAPLYFINGGSYAAQEQGPASIWLFKNRLLRDGYKTMDGFEAQQYTPEYLDNFSRKAMHNMQNLIEEDTLILPSVLELIKPTKSFGKALSRLDLCKPRPFAAFLRPYLRRVKRTISDIDKAPLKEVTRLVSNGYLGASFGVMPTLEDCKIVVEEFRSGGKTLEKLVSDQKIWRSYYHRSVDAKDDFYKKHTLPYGPDKRTTYTSKATLTASAQRQYTVDDLGIFATRAGHIAARLGVTRPISMLWEVAPWSFAIDWFVDVGDFLTQFETAANPTTSKVKDFCLSLKLEEMAAYYITVRPDCGNPETLLGTHFRTRYTRWPFGKPPTGFFYPTYNCKMGLTQWSYALALGRQLLSR